MIKAYIDCNILIDWLIDRDPYSYYAAKIIESTEEDKIKIYVSALTLANTYYIVSKKLDKRIADEFLKDSLTLFQFVNITEKAIKNAIEDRYKDFEDDLHYHTAVEFKLDYIITRNKKDFKNKKIKIVDSEEFLKIIFDIF